MSMRVCLASDNFNDVAKILDYLNESLDIVIATINPEVKNFGYVSIMGKSYSLFCAENLSVAVSKSSSDYVLTSSLEKLKELIANGVDESKIIDIESILNREFTEYSLLMASLKNRISDCELVAVGGFPSLMGFDVKDLSTHGINLSSKFQDLWASYHWLNKIFSLPRNKVKYVLIGLSPYSFRYDLSSSSDKWQTLAYYPLFKSVHHLPISTKLIKTLFNDKFCCAYDLLDTDSENVKGAITSTTLDDPLNERQISDRQLERQEIFGARPEARKWENPKFDSCVAENSELFIKCLRLCDENGVTPIVVRLPVHYSYKSLYPKHLVEEFDVLIERAKKVVPFHLVDAFSSWNVGVNEIFCRLDSLNTYGARLLTTNIKPLIEKLERKKIRIGFICQGGDLGKLQPIYEAAQRQGEKIDSVLLLVPPRENYDTKPFDLNDPRYIKAQKEATENYGGNPNTFLVQTLTKEGLTNIENLRLDYLIYKRPYNSLMLPNLHINVTSNFTKTCYVPYGVNTIKPFVELARDHFDFFSSLHFLFAESEYCAQEMCKSYKTDAENSDQHFIFCGSPELEEVCTEFSTSFESNLNKKKKSVLWTPRWTEEIPVGGSHFIEYKDRFVDLRQKYPNTQFSIRPHPLLFPNMLKKNRMTEAEIRLYKERLKACNIYLDEDSDHLFKALITIFLKSDIMITDISSIMPLAFVTGNPIIYCSSGYEFCGNAEVMEPGIYTAENWNQVEKYLGMLLSGEDPLKETRRNIIKEMHRLHGNSANRVVQALMDDYNSSLREND